MSREQAGPGVTLGHCVCWVSSHAGGSTDNGHQRLTGQIQAVAAEARSLEARASVDRSRATLILRERLDELAGALEVDRALRLSSPLHLPGEELFEHLFDLSVQFIVRLVVGVHAVA